MTTLVHLSKDGNFQTRTEATVVGCNVVDENEIIGEVVVELQVDVTSMHPQGEVSMSDENARNQFNLSSPALKAAGSLRILEQ